MGKWALYGPTSGKYLLIFIHLSRLSHAKVLILKLGSRVMFTMLKI
jgi:hypothetical protein